MTEKIKEDVNVKVNADGSTKINISKDDYSIYDVVVDLETGQEAVVEHITELINGKLEAIIVDIDSEPITFAIYLHPFMNIELLSLMNVTGQRYIAVRTETNTESNEKFNYTQDKYAINDQLHIVMEGRQGSKAQFIFRLCKY